MSSPTAFVCGELDKARVANDAAARAWAVTTSQFASAQQASLGSEVGLATGDLDSARRWADDAVAVLVGWHRAMALVTRARVAIAQGQPDQPERDTQDALRIAAEIGAYVAIPDALELLARVAYEGRHLDAVRLLAAASTMRQRMSLARYVIHQDDYEVSVAGRREALGDNDFNVAWEEGAALTAEQATALARRGRGERRRSETGWKALTPAELDVVGLVCEGLGNKEIAARLFISPRTVQAHLTHVYAKLGLTSRTQLVHASEAATSGPDRKTPIGSPSGSRRFPR